MNACRKAIFLFALATTGVAQDERLIELVLWYSIIPPNPPKKIEEELRAIPDVEARIWKIIEAPVQARIQRTIDVLDLVGGGTSALLKSGLATDYSLEKCRTLLREQRDTFDSFKEPSDIPGHQDELGFTHYDGENAQVAVEMRRREQLIFSMKGMLGELGDSTDLELIAFFEDKPEFRTYLLGGQCARDLIISRAPALLPGAESRESDKPSVSLGSSQMNGARSKKVHEIAVPPAQSPETKPSSGRRWLLVVLATGFIGIFILLIRAFLGRGAA